MTTTVANRKETIRHLITLFEKMDVDGALTLFTEDAYYRFGNYPPAKGKAAIAETTRASHLDQVKNIQFEILRMWEEGDSLICKMDIHYTLVNGKVLTLPCTDVFRFEGEKVKEMLVYMDATPLFMPPVEEEAPPSENLSELVKKSFTAVENNDIDTYLTYFTDDAVYKIANYDPVIGHQGIREFALPVMQMFKTVSHEVKEMWEFDNTVICEMDIIYTRNDDKVFTIPSLDIFKFKDGKVQQLEAFLDASPAFS